MNKEQSALLRSSIDMREWLINNKADERLILESTKAIQDFQYMVTAPQPPSAFLREALEKIIEQSNRGYFVPFSIQIKKIAEEALAASPVEDNQEKAGPEVRDVKKWPPEKDGWYWCIVEGRPSALGKWLLRLEYNKSEGGFLQEDDGYIPIQYLTNDLQITIHHH